MPTLSHVCPFTAPEFFISFPLNLLEWLVTWAAFVNFCFAPPFLSWFALSFCGCAVLLKVLNVSKLLSGEVLLRCCGFLCASDDFHSVHFRDKSRLLPNWFEPCFWITVFGFLEMQIKVCGRVLFSCAQVQISDAPDNRCGRDGSTQEISPSLVELISLRYGNGRKGKFNSLNCWNIFSLKTSTPFLPYHRTHNHYRRIKAPFESITFLDTALLLLAWRRNSGTRELSSL